MVFSQTHLQQRLGGQDTASDELDDTLLVNTFEVLYKLKVILHDPVSVISFLFHKPSMSDRRAGWNVMGQSFGSCKSPRENYIVIIMKLVRIRKQYGIFNTNIP